MSDPPVRTSSPVKVEPTVNPVRSYNKQKKWKSTTPKSGSLDDLHEIQMDDLGKAILVPAEEGDQGDQQTFQIRLDKSMTLPSDFPIMSSNVYLVTE